LDDQIKDAEMGGACGTLGSSEKYIQNVIEDFEGNRPLGSTCRWEGKIKMDVKEIRMWKRGLD
jgi:hypothetical protein